MSLKRCNTCGGEYDDVLRDGLLYFHTCPPITRVRVLRDAQRQVVDLADVRPTDTVRAQRGARDIEVLVSELQPDDVRLGDVQRERPDRRDENAAPAGGEEEPDPRVPRGRRLLKARGRGTTAIAGRSRDVV